MNLSSPTPPRGYRKSDIAVGDSDRGPTPPSGSSRFAAATERLRRIDADWLPSISHGATPRVYIPGSRWVTMLHLDRDLRLDPGHCREDMVQDLLGRRAELSTTRRHLQPARLIAVIALREVLGADHDHVAVVGEIHVTSSRGQSATWLGLVATARFEMTPRRSPWLGRGHAERRGGPDYVEIPRRRSGARRAVFGSECLATDACGPALGRVPLGETQERGPIGDADGAALDDEVKSLERDREDAVGVRGKVPTLTRIRTAREVDRAVDPESADGGNVRSAFGLRGCQPVRRCGTRLELLERARPPDRRRTVDVEMFLGRSRHLRRTRR